MSYYNKNSLSIKRELYDLYLLYPEECNAYYVDKLRSLGFVSADLNCVLAANKWFQRWGYFAFEKIRNSENSRIYGSRKTKLRDKDF